MQKYFYILLFSFGLIFAQHRVLVDDAPMCGWHDRYTYQALWDTLTSAGCTVDFTTDVGRYPDLSLYDFVVLMHHGYCPSAGFSYDQRTQLINFVCSGGQILIMPMADLAPLSEFLSDPRWNTGIQLINGGFSTHTTCIASFSPFTDGISYLDWGVDAELLVNTPAYPFVWDDACDMVLAAISYPRGVDDFECDVCETGGRIIVLGENHTYEYSVVGYVEPMSYRFIVNILTSLAGVGDTLNPCELPEDIPILDSIPCVSPGDIAHLYGDKIPSDIILYFDGVPISFTWLDSTEITFTVPTDAEQGYHTVTVEVDGHPFRTQIRVYCDWLDLTFFEPYCADIGDTVWFYGQNFSLSASITFSGVSLTDFHIENDTSGWLVVPDTTGLTGYPSIGQSYRYQVCVENEPTQRDCRWIYVPCPCPPDSEINAVIENVRFWERTDGTDTVYIVYDLIADSSQNIVLWCSSDGGATWNVLCTGAYGAIGEDVAPGESLVIVWPAGEDVPNTENTNWTFRIGIADSGGTFVDAIYSLFVSTIGGTDYEYSWSVIKTLDNGFGVTGYSTSYGAGSNDFLFVKTNSSGLTEWARAIGGLNEDIGYSATQISDGSYIITGSSVSFSGLYKFFLVKLNASGFPVWSKILNSGDAGRSIITTSDGGYAAVGWTSIGAGMEDLFFVKFNSADTVDLCFAYGGSGRERGYSVIQTTDGGYAIIGETSGFGVGAEDIIVVKLYASGAVEWARTIGGTDYDRGRSIIQTTDGGYIITGGTQSFGAGAFDLLILKLSSDGSLEWAKAIGGTSGDFGRSVIKTIEGGYLVAGWTQSYGFGGGYEDVFVVKFDSTGSVENSLALGGTNHELGCSVVPTADGGYVVGGYTISFGAGQYDFMLIKLDAEVNSCMGNAEMPIVTNISPAITMPTLAATSLPDSEAIVSPTITNVFPNEIFLCSDSVLCPFGGLYFVSESSPGPLDTWCPRISATCPPDGEVGESAIINWTVEDSFLPPNTLAPVYPMELWFSSDGGASWNYIGASANTGSFDWVYPSVLTSDAYIMVCATDSFGHQCCDTCGPFTITGDTVSPWGYAYADTCSPDKVFFILQDDVGMNWSSVCIQDPLGVLCYPDSMELVGDTMIIFHPRLPDSIMDISRYFYVRLWSAEDSSGNSLPEMLVDDSLTVQFRHPCCFPAMVWRQCPPGEWNGWSSCSGQGVTFGVLDTTGQEIDTTRIFVRQSINGVESEIPADSLQFGHSGDTVWVIVPGDYSDTDSVWIIMDSLFTMPGCRTNP